MVQKVWPGLYLARLATSTIHCDLPARASGPAFGYSNNYSPSLLVGESPNAQEARPEVQLSLDLRFESDKTLDFNRDARAR